MKITRLIAMIGLTILQFDPIYSFSLEKIIDRAQDGTDSINGQNGENGQNGAVGQDGGHGGSGPNGGNGGNG